jgi:alkyl sulfatase BDS1-like metallo-beta-lactamase superfamily hydrolase
MGWYDANPVHLHALPPEESARKWMAYMNLGSVEAVLRQARADFDAGEFQWVAEVTNTIVFADPENREARLLCADALEQLGYQAESGTWRNAYLTGALELRQGNAVRAGQTNISSGGVVDMMQNMTASNILDFLAILLDKEALGERDFTVNFHLVDTGECFALRFKNGAVLPYMGIAVPDAGLSVTTKKDALFLLMGGQFETFVSVARLEGDVDLLKFVVASCNQFNPTQSQDFNIVEP